MALSRVFTDLKIGTVPHGFRSSFRDWAAEKTNHPREVVEAALAQVVRDKVEAAYARSDLFERRRHLMNDWAAYLEERRSQVPATERRRSECDPGQWPPITADPARSITPPGGGEPR